MYRSVSPKCLACILPTRGYIKINEEKDCDKNMKGIEISLSKHKSIKVTLRVLSRHGQLQACGEPAL